MGKEIDKNKKNAKLMLDMLYHLYEESQKLAEITLEKLQNNEKMRKLRY